MSRHRVTFKWEFAFGHLIQLVAGIAAAVSLYILLVTDVAATKALAAENALAINELREEFHDEALRREQRYMRQLHEIKDDVRWLVRNRGSAKKVPK